MPPAGGMAHNVTISHISGIVQVFDGGNNDLIKYTAHLKDTEPRSDQRSKWGKEVCLL